MLGEFGGCFMGVSGAVSLGALLIVAAWTLGVSATARLIIFTAWGPHRVTREWLVGRSRDSHRKGACRAVSAILVTHFVSLSHGFLHRNRCGSAIHLLLRSSRHRRWVGVGWVQPQAAGGRHDCTLDDCTLSGALQQTLHWWRHLDGLGSGESHTRLVTSTLHNFCRTELDQLRLNH